MANYATLKAAIQSVIKQNGNNEITGALLQQSLLSMINSLGANYQFAGVAIPTTNPGTPDQNVFYLAGVGTFANFGGTVVEQGDIGVFTYNGTWGYHIIDLAGIFRQKIDGHVNIDKVVEVKTGQTALFNVAGSYGKIIRARIVSKTAVADSVRLTVTSNGATSTTVLTNEWQYIEKTAEITRIYVFAFNVTTGGQIVVEFDYGAFAELINFTETSIAEINSHLGFDDVPTAASLNAVKSNGIFLEQRKIAYPQVTVTRKNLFNPSAVRNGYYINSSGNYAASSAFACSEIIPVDPNTDYFLSILLPNATPVGNVNSYGYYYKKDGTKSLFSTNTTSVHTPNDCYAVEFSYLKNYESSVQFEKGTQRTAYESFIPSNLFSIMDNVPVIGSINPAKSNGIALEFNKTNFEKVVVARKNLFNPNAIRNGYYINSSGEYKASGSFACSEFIPVIPDTDYCLSAGPALVVGNANSYGYFYKTDGTKILFSTNSMAVHTPANCYALEFSYIKSREANVQLEKGTQRTTYEPFMGSDFETALNNSPVVLMDYESILPRQIFVIKGEQNSVYHSEYCKNYDDKNIYADKVAGIWAYFERCWRIQSTDNPTGNLSFLLRNRRTDGELKSFNIPTIVGDKTKTTPNIKVNCIGDSFCYAGYYIKQIADCCANADFVGMRKTANFPNLYCEGRGGWSLAEYFSPISSDISLSHIQPFSPFMHAAGYNYYGVIEFWASIVNGTSQYPYGTNGFDNYTSWFGADGRKVNPVVNDLMYNQTAGKYEYYNGSSWVQLSTAPTFEFNYAKYIDVWQITAPDFVVVQLGTNDFYHGVSGLDAWLSNMDLVVASINAYAASVSKTINILLCTVLTASGTPNNTYGDGIIKKNHYYYEARKAIINKYDALENYTNNRVTVVDTGVVVDDKFGFMLDEQKPFDYYEGSERELFDTNGVHPSIAGYKQFGNPIAGAIQYLR